MICIILLLKNRDDKEIVNNKFEDKEDDYINFNDIKAPNHYIGRKNDNVMLRLKNLIS